MAVSVRGLFMSSREQRNENAVTYVLGEKTTYLERTRMPSRPGEHVCPTAGKLYQGVPK